MHRRNFLRSAALLSVTTAAGCKTAFPASTTTGPARIKPARLRAGDTVLLICPGGPITESRLISARENIEALGLQVKLGKHVLAVRGSTAGTDAQRLEDLHAGFSDPTIRAVWAIRGGYGCTRLLPDVDFDLIRNNPKLLIGYSDITALLNVFYQRLGLTGLHAPVASSSFPPFNLEQLQLAAFNGTAPQVIDRLPTGKTLVNGQATGPLVGGNISLLAAMAGTPFAFDATDKLVFLEDVGEAPYRIDRMLTQLRQSANLGRARGFVLGDFVDCEHKGDSPSLTLKETLMDRLGDLGVPTCLGFPFGHGTLNATLPIGVSARLDADAGTLTLMESAVS